MSIDPLNLVDVIASGKQVAIKINAGDILQDMTLRDYFAAKAMQALLSDIQFDVEANDVPKTISEYSYAMADGMLKAREVK